MVVKVIDDRGNELLVVKSRKKQREELNVDVTVSRKLLMDLVRDAEAGTVVLPEFQRDFIWSREGVRDIVHSLQGFYIGSLLLLKTDAEHLPFEARCIAGVVNSHGSVTPEYMVLDGQQRMTSLHYALRRPQLRCAIRVGDTVTSWI